MAGTIKSTTGISHSNGNLSVPVASKTKEIVQTEQSAYQNTQVIGTTAEDITKGDVSTLGIVVLENLDSTNFVDVGINDSGTLKDGLRVLAGERWPFRAKPGVTLMAKADTAAVRLHVTIYGA